MSASATKEIDDLIKSLQERRIVKDFAIYRLDQLIYSTIPEDKAKELLNHYFETDIKVIWMGDYNTAVFFFGDYTILVKPASILTMFQVNKLIKKWREKKEKMLKIMEEKIKEKPVAPKTKEEKEVSKPEKVAIKQAVAPTEMDRKEFEEIHVAFSKIFIDRVIDTLYYLIGKSSTDDIIQKVGGREKLLNRENFDKFLTEIEKMLGKRTREIILHMIEI